jgi:hypothetical protein
LATRQTHRATAIAGFATGFRHLMPSARAGFRGGAVESGDPSGRFRCFWLWFSMSRRAREDAARGIIAEECGEVNTIVFFVVFVIGIASRAIQLLTTPFYLRDPVSSPTPFHLPYYCVFYCIFYRGHIASKSTTCDPVLLPSPFHLPGLPEWKSTGRNCSPHSSHPPQKNQGKKKKAEIGNLDVETGNAKGRLDIEPHPGEEIRLTEMPQVLQIKIKLRVGFWRIGRLPCA